MLHKDTCLLACLLADYGRGFLSVKYFAQFFHNLAYFNTIFNFLANKKCLKKGKNRFYTDLEHKHSAMRKQNIIIVVNKDNPTLQNPARFLHAPAA